MKQNFLDLICTYIYILLRQISSLEGDWKFCISTHTEKQGSKQRVGKLSWNGPEGKYCRLFRCHGLNCSSFQNSCVKALTSSVTDSQGEVRSWGWGPNSLPYGKRETLVCSLYHVRSEQKVTICKPGREPSPKAGSCQAWISAFPVHETTHSCCLSHPVHGSLLGQPEQTDITVTWSLTQDLQHRHSLRKCINLWAALFYYDFICIHQNMNFIEFWHVTK
jgi:hypothetical protein